MSRRKSTGKPHEEGAQDLCGSKRRGSAATHSPRTLERVGIPLFPGIDLHQLADAATLAGRLSDQGRATPVFAAARRAPVPSAQRVRLTPDTAFEHCPQLDVLIVAGRPRGRSDSGHGDDDLERFVRAQHPGVRRLVCVGTGERLVRIAGCADPQEPMDVDTCNSH